MMVYFALTSLVVLIVINGIINGRLFCFPNLFLILWTMVIIANRFSFIDFYDVDDKTYLAVLFGCSGFVIGSWLVKLFKSHVKVDSIGNFMGDEPNIIILDLLALLMFAVSITMIVRVYHLIRMGYSFRMLRSILQGYEDKVSFTTNRVQSLMMHWIAFPLNYFLPVVAVASLMNKKKYNFFYTLVLVDELMYFFYTQSRFAMLYIVIELAIGIYVFSDQISDNLKRLIIIFFVGIVVLILAISIMRFENSKWSGLRNFVLYLGGPLSLLDRMIKYIDDIEYSASGLNFIYGWLVSIKGVFKIAGIEGNIIPPILEKINNSKEIYQRIGNRIWFNAFYSVFCDFYIDFHLYGEVFGGLIFGALFENRISNMIMNRKSIKSVCLGMMLCIAVCMSVVRWQYVIYSFCFSYIYLLISFINYRGIEQQ